MKTIMILAAGNVVASGITSLLDVFSFCNIYWRRMQPQANSDLFAVHIISPDGQAITTNHGFQIPAIGIERVDLTAADALLLASAFVTDRDEFSQFQQAFSPLMPALVSYANTGKPIAAYCSGSMMLAASGLLAQRKATTAWWLSDLFRQQFPDVTLCMDSLVVNDGQFYSAGATSACLSLALSVVEVLAGSQLAHQLSKVLLVAPNRGSQQPFMTIAMTTAFHQDSLITEIQQWMQLHLAVQYQLDDIAAHFALGKRTLIRRFKKALHETPASYWQRLRIDEAKRLLETTDLTLEQITSKIGYEDVGSFRKLFIQQTSLSPRAYRSKFNSHCCE
ncbi:GlxA family transcriptional regulator [Shewanella sp. NIFS-20-20]|uniref:GlxA family transcriptional regulator n=1 Tax=Shewanella sp. NIFS-20-20 TaxID=2853806 RepID=UPI001C46D208|nr:helix-turn-helix domain-containing protein [Shewanella sp. NIFS-20-20]MBV7317236.1 helix-turn-helix domain-containing protein [Shewanella sp. NIFS-20-20]